MFNAPPSINYKLYQSKGKKMAIFFGMVMLFIPALISGITALAMLGYLIRGNAKVSDLTAGLVGAIICAVSIFGLIKLVPLFRRPVDFQPRFSNIPPAAYGYPFDVRLQRKTMGSAFDGEGVVQFFPDHLIVDGHRETNGYIQLAILAAVTIVPILVFGFGLGFIPAAILAKYVGRKKVIQPIHYQAIRSIKINGNIATIDCPNLSPAKSVFYVASQDGSRLHGEIHPRFATILQRVPAT